MAQSFTFDLVQKRDHMRRWQSSREGFKVLFLVFLLCQAALVAARFNWVYVDADQLITAVQAGWIAKGQIFEPNFYGQSYLIPLDAYLGSLLVLLGFTPLAAVQTCNIFFFNLAFGGLAFLFRKKSPVFLGALGLLFLCLPFKFLIVAQMARAFTTVISIACFVFALCVFAGDDKTKKTHAISGMIIGFCMGAFTGAFVLLPAILLVRGRGLFFKLAASVIVGFLLSKCAAVFYALNPDYLVHHQSTLTFSAADFFLNWQNPDIRRPLLQLFLPGFLIISLLHAVYTRIPYWARIQAIWAFLGFVGTLVLMLATQKIRDFSAGSPFFSVERMFIAVPFFFVLLIAHLASSLEPKSQLRATFPRLPNVSSRGWAIIGSVSLFLCFAVSVQRLNRYISKNRDVLAHAPSPAVVTSLEKLTQECLQIHQKLPNPSENYLYFIGRNDTLVYGCSALMNVPIVQSVYERRTWLARFYEQNGFRKIEYHPN